MFDVKTDRGVATGRVDGVYMDAAVAGETAGLELSLQTMHAFDERDGRRAPLTLALDMAPAVMQDLALLLAQKSGLPAFTEGEWATIANICDAAAGASKSMLATRIRDAYGWTD